MFHSNIDERTSLPRKPNYKFERFERERAKAEKKAARLQARADRKSALDDENQATGDAGGESVDRPSDKTNSDQV